jgi:hypothetical protein
MIEPYRKAIGSDVRHFCSNCTTWPDDAYIASLSPEKIGSEELCTECIAAAVFSEVERIVFAADGLILAHDFPFNCETRA